VAVYRKQRSRLGSLHPVLLFKRRLAVEVSRINLTPRTNGKAQTNIRNVHGNLKSWQFICVWNAW